MTINTPTLAHALLLLLWLAQREALTTQGREWLEGAGR